MAVRYHDIGYKQGYERQLGCNIKDWAPLNSRHILAAGMTAHTRHTLVNAYACEVCVGFLGIVIMGCNRA